MTGTLSAVGGTLTPVGGSIVGLGGTGPAWSPLSLSPAVWLDASATSTIATSGSGITQWNDKSGNGRHFQQTTTSARPTTGVATLNGRNVLSLDGGDELFGSVPAETCHVVLVAAWSGTRNGFYGGASAATPGAFQQSNGSATWRLDPSPDATAPLGASSAAAIVEIEHSEAMKVWKNGTPLAVTGSAPSITPGSTITRVGALGRSVVRMTGVLAEFLVLPDLPTSDERTSLLDYLTLKWAIS